MHRLSFFRRNEICWAENRNIIILYVDWLCFFVDCDNMPACGFKLNLFCLLETRDNVFASCFEVFTCKNLATMHRVCTL